MQRILTEEEYQALLFKAEYHSDIRKIIEECELDLYENPAYVPNICRNEAFKDIAGMLGIKLCERQ